MKHEPLTGAATNERLTARVLDDDEVEEIEAEKAKKKKLEGAEQ